MNFIERYRIEKTWQGKVTLMGIYHQVKVNKYKEWTIKDTADYFECSVGLTSENIRLAQMFHHDTKLMKCDTRQEALGKMDYKLLWNKINGD